MYFSTVSQRWGRHLRRLLLFRTTLPYSMQWVYVLTMYIVATSIYLACSNTNIYWCTSFSQQPKDHGCVHFTDVESEAVSLGIYRVIQVKVAPLGLEVRSNLFEIHGNLLVSKPTGRMPGLSVPPLARINLIALQFPTELLCASEGRPLKHENCVTLVNGVPCLTDQPNFQTREGSISLARKGSPGHAYLW